MTYSEKQITSIQSRLGNLDFVSSSIRCENYFEKTPSIELVLVGDDNQSNGSVVVIFNNKVLKKPFVGYSHDGLDSRKYHDENLSIEQIVSIVNNQS